MSWKDRYSEIKVGDIVEYYRFTDANGKENPNINDYPYKKGTILEITEIINTLKTGIIFYTVKSLDSSNREERVFSSEIRKV
jgi:hypothetical protein